MNNSSVEREKAFSATIKQEIEVLYWKNKCKDQAMIIMDLEKEIYDLQATANK
jgi:hypothetical protein